MAGRIVVFGATGYTGRLTVEALIARGGRPVLAGRDAVRLRELAAEVGPDLETAVADVSEPASVAELVEPADVLVATVGPFARFGDAACDAAISRGAHYIDSTGEPAFIRRVFERFGARAGEARIAMLTAFGYDWVPGNLAGALALREAGGAATRVDVGYFLTGGGLGGMSGGTRASLAGALLEPAFVWRDGVRSERSAARVRSFEAAGRRREAISVGSSEHFTLPRLEPDLREVNVYLGWFGGASRAMQAFSAANATIMRVPGVKSGAGFDRIFGGRGNDRLRGNSGADTVVGEDGRDSIAAGTGRDVLGAEDQRRDRSINCGGGRDRVSLDRRLDPGATRCEVTN